MNISEALTVVHYSRLPSESGLWAVIVRFPQGDRISTDVPLYINTYMYVFFLYIYIVSFLSINMYIYILYALYVCIGTSV